jgi:D-sedoheptulose 7-phosphate isomerase
MIRAVETAKALGCKTLALTGGTGEPLASISDFAVIVPSSRTARIQEAHITIGHIWCEMAEAILGKGNSEP